MSGKAGLYATSLDAARRANLYDHVCPVDSHGKVRQGSSRTHHSPDGLEWKELVRKFSKHNPQREVTGQAALTELSIRTALAKAAEQSGFDSDKSHVHDEPAGQGKYARLTWPALIRNEDRSSVLTSIQSLDNSIRNASGSDVDKGSAKIIKAFGLFSIGDCQNALRELDDLPEKQLAIPLAHSEVYDRILRVLAYAVEGYSHDLLGDSKRATGAYLDGIKEYSRTHETLGRSSTTDTDETLHAIGEDIIYRAAMHTRAQQDHSNTYSLHKAYMRHLQHWGPSFRPTKAIILHASYRSLLHELGTSKLSPREFHCEMARNNRGQEALLRRTTALPPAGEINKLYLDFLDDVVLGWRIGGAGRQGAESVVKICYNALTHTFQSQKLLRHLARALVALERTDEVRKTLELYYDLWDKARETDAAQVAKDVRKFRRKNELEQKGASPETVRQLVAEEDEKEVETDFDDDATFVEFAVWATRIWCRLLKDPAHGKVFADRAKKVLDETQDAPLKGDAHVQSAVSRSLGIAYSTLAVMSDEYESRTTNQATALKHFEDAVAFDTASPDSQYCLAYELAELRQITPAIEHARQAVQLDSSSKQAWHLLGLLVAAQQDLEQALQVVETALDADSSRVGTGVNTPANGKADDQPEYKTSGVPSFLTFLSRGGGGDNNNKDQQQDNATTNGTISTSKSTAVDGKKLSRRLTFGNNSGSSSKLAAVNWYKPRNEWDLLEEELELRKTRNLLIEFLEGPESAVSDQKSLFSFFTNTVSDINASIEQDAKFEAEQAVASNTEANLGGAASVPSTVAVTRRKSISRKSISEKDGAADDTNALRRTTSRLSIRSNKSRKSTRSNKGAASGPADDLDEKEALSSSSATSHPRARKMLTDLWLMTAASYRRAGRLDDARGAIQEAEKLYADSPDVWVQFALCSQKANSLDIARTSVLKALEYEPTHVPSTIILARLYLMEDKTVPVAEGMLETLTRTKAWDVPEAWFELSRCYKATERRSKEQEALVWALQLEQTRGVRDLSLAVPRML